MDNGIEPHRHVQKINVGASEVFAFIHPLHLPHPSFNPFFPGALDLEGVGRSPRPSDSPAGAHIIYIYSSCGCMYSSIMYLYQLLNTYKYMSSGVERLPACCSCFVLQPKGPSNQRTIKRQSGTLYAQHHIAIYVEPRY